MAGVHPLVEELGEWEAALPPAPRPRRRRPGSSGRRRSGRPSSALDSVQLGVVPFGAALRLPIGNDFTVVDARLLVIEDRYTAHWLDEADAVAVHRRVWDAHAASAVYGADVRRIISRARRDLGVRARYVEAAGIGFALPERESGAWWGLPACFFGRERQVVAGRAGAFGPAAPAGVVGGR
ncbi:Scr1 family TA system antitoxin-like transcriptional regulator [Streptomyces sp. NPDC010273]|uniref:Scr1 family TA system antitoxin-like transcriptional regulator n=1 Tax=Streptomyces sp. NPDC010273 TaxID=3364829 RepID=UPI0036EF57C1